jgi:hypothetical protein
MPSGKQQLQILYENGCTSTVGADNEAESTDEE